MAAVATAAIALPPVEQEAQGTCATPRQAWIQLLYWLQRGQSRWRPDQAAKCFDVSRLGSAGVAAERAVMLKEVLDSRNAWIEINELPTNPDYRDNITGTYRHIDPVVKEQIGDKIYLLRNPQTRRWLFSSETLEYVPSIYPGIVKSLQERLPGWGRSFIFGIELWKYLAMIAMVLLALAFKGLVVMILHRYVRAFILRTQLTYLGRAVERSDRPIGGLAMAVVFSIAIPQLLLPARVTELLLFAVDGLAAFSLVWLGYRLIDTISDLLMSKAARTESKLDDQLVPLVSKTLKVFVSVIGGIFVMQNLGVDVGSLIAGLGLGGLAFALAAKDTLANLFGSLMIFIDKPFQIGDWVVISGTEGIVEEVGFRSSRVRTFYNSVVTVPNAMVTTAVVDNYGARQYRRYVSNLGLAYDTPPHKMEAFCEGVRAIIARPPGMRKDYYLVEFKEFGPSSLTVMVYCFMVAATWNEELRIRTNLNLDIMRLASDLGVSFAFPTQTLHIGTLPQMGQSLPSHHGPTQTSELASVIQSYGPDGKAGHPRGSVIGGNFDCDAPQRGADQS